MDPTYTPFNEPEQQELYESKQTFMFSVFNANLQTDMGKTIVRRYLTNPDAQSVWRELSEDHFTYHVAQASQAKHGSLVDRGANGGLAGSDVRILSRSSRECTVTGIDSHELQGLDVVQCAALVETNHGIVNLIMNEYV